MNPFCYGVLDKARSGIDFAFIPLYAGYPILGAMLYEQFRNAEVNVFVRATTVAVIALSVTIAEARASALSHGVPAMAFFEYSSPTVIVASAGSFVALRAAFDRITIALLRIAASTVAKRTMSIYFMHLLLARIFVSHSK